MRRIFEFIRSITSRNDLTDAEVYFQVLGERVADSGLPKVKVKVTTVSEDTGNELIVNVTEIGKLDCGHWNIELAGQCVICGATFCKYCISERTAGFACAGCGRFVCRACARHSLFDHETALCGQCGSLGSLPSLFRRYLCG